MISIAFLRGINVGGHLVKMGCLRELFTELGFTHVRTYIQSGNAFFETANGLPAAQGFKALGDRTTTRFFHTTAKILQAAKKGEKSQAPQ